MTRRPSLHPLPEAYPGTSVTALLATWFGSGLLRPGAGTWGSVAALPFALALGFLGGGWLLLAATGAIFAAGTWAAERLGRALGEVDASQIVVDEVAGQWLALVPVFWLASPGPSWAWSLLAGFVLFRLFDVTKPWPAGAFDRLKTAWGVMLDDIAAGLYAAVLVGAALWLGWL